MDRRLLLLACGALATAISLATCTKLTENHYLELPSKSSMKNSAYKQLRKDLLKIDATPRDSPSSIMDRIKDAAAKSPQTSEGRNVYAELSEFDKIDESCTPSDTQLVLDIIAVIRDNPVLKSFLMFVKRYGHLKFTHCYAKREIRQKLEEINEGEQKLERFFEVALSIDRNTKNKYDQLDMVRDFNLAASDFDARKVAEFLGLLNKSKETKRDRTSAIKLIKNYLHGACNEIKRGREDALKTACLARALGSGGTLIWRVTKMIEYNRVCLDLQNPEILLKFDAKMKLLL